MHIVGGYAEQRVDRPYHHVYEAAADRWARRRAAAARRQPCRRRLSRRQALRHRRLPRAEPQAASALLRLGSEGRPLGRDRAPAPPGRLGRHRRAGRSAPCHRRRHRRHLRHQALDRLAPGLRSEGRHTGASARRCPRPATIPARWSIGNLIHVIGGRVDSFHTNSNLHHAYDPATDKWTPRNPLPTARSGHGAVLYRGKVFVMGGEGTNRVFGQMEAYDPAADRWEQYAPMPTPAPRPGRGAGRRRDPCRRRRPGHGRRRAERGA